MSSNTEIRGKFVPLLPPSCWWWQWSDEGSVIVWRFSETTIAFRSHIEAILSYFTPEDLPVPGSLIYLLAAFRDDWREEDARKVLHELVERCGGGIDEYGKAAELLILLGKVRALPDELRRLFRVHVELASMIFKKPAQGIRRTEERQSRIKAWRQHQVESAEARKPSLGELHREWQPLLKGLIGINEQSLRTRMATGLHAPPVAADLAELDVPRTAALRGIPSDSLDDVETSGVAFLARQVMAVVSLPRALEAPADLPDGGVADITNRGPLDRLLLSELAHDESIFAARLALGEALYHRRELSAPPPPRGRYVLLDSGIRMWGVPRVYATSVALALIAQAGPEVGTTVYRSSAVGLVPVDLSTKEGIIDHLRALEISAHPGMAMEPFLSAIASAPHCADAVLVTCEEVLADADFQRQLATYSVDLIHIVTVARDGRLRLLTRSRRGMRVVREATLDVSTILAKPPEGVRHSQRPLFNQESQDLPAIFYADPFPLRLSVGLGPSRSWHVDGVGAFTYTEDGRLLLWDIPDLGPRQISERLPRGKLIAYEPLAHSGQTLAVVGNEGGPKSSIYALRIDCISMRVESVLLDVGKVCPPDQSFHIHAGRVLFCRRGTLIELDPVSGAILSKCQMPKGGGKRQIGRVVQFLDGGDAYVMAAGPARYEVVPSGGLDLSKMLAVFTTVGVEGFTIVTPDGELISGPESKRFKIKHSLSLPLSVSDVSRDGKRFSLSGTPERYRKIVDIEDVLMGREIDKHSGLLDWWLLDKMMSPLPFKTRFSGIGRGHDGELKLVSGDGSGHCNMWSIHLELSGLRWTRSNVTGDFSFQAFKRCGLRSQYDLRSVRFADGTSAWLDSRGLLHLRSSIRTIPEITLVTSMEVECYKLKRINMKDLISGWLSDGRVFGPIYSHGGKITDSGVIYREVIQPIIRAIRD